MSYFNLKSRYNFNTLAPAILGVSVKNATIMGLFDSTIAANYMNVQTNHAQIYPSLPPGTVNDPTQYDYFLIRTQSGDKRVLAIQWIDVNSIQLVTQQAISITVNGTTTGDDVKIRNALLMMGFSSISMSVTST